MGAVVVLLVIIIAGIVTLDFHLRRTTAEPEILRPSPTLEQSLEARPILEPPPTPTVIVIPIALPETTITAPPTPTQVDTDENAGEPEIYEVLPGDSLIAIAVQFGMDVQEIIDLNDIVDPSLINVGQKLLIPPE